MEQHTNPEPEGGLGARRSARVPVSSLPRPGAESGARASVEGRWREFSPLEERSQRMHRFTGNLLAAVGDATAGGVEGVALGCLNAAEAGEAVLELHEVMARLKGSAAGAAGARRPAGRLRPGRRAGAGEHRRLADPPRTGLGSFRAEAGASLSRPHGRFALTGSALLAGDIDAAQAEVIVSAVKRLPEDLEAGARERAEKVMLAEAQRLDAAQLQSRGAPVVGGHRPRRRRGGSKPDGCARKKTPQPRRPG